MSMKQIPHLQGATSPGFFWILDKANFLAPAQLWRFFCKVALH
jgi:hypothetical protein